MDQVSIKNVSSATVVLSVPELKFRRELVPGRTIFVSKEDYKELSEDLYKVLSDNSRDESPFLFSIIDSKIVINEKLLD